MGSKFIASPTMKTAISTVLHVSRWA